MPGSLSLDLTLIIYMFLRLGIKKKEEKEDVMSKVIWKGMKGNFEESLLPKLVYSHSQCDGTRCYYFNGKLVDVMYNPVLSSRGNDTGLTSVTVSQHFKRRTMCLNSPDIY